MNYEITFVYNFETREPFLFDNITEAKRYIKDVLTRYSRDIYVKINGKYKQDVVLNKLKLKVKNEKIHAVMTITTNADSLDQEDLAEQLYSKSLLDEFSIIITDIRKKRCPRKTRKGRKKGENPNLCYSRKK
jgi:hypothetical protein